MYKQAFLITKVIQDGENLKLDLPFTIYWQNTTFNNISYYEKLTSEMVNQDVLVLASYDDKDEKDVKKFAGYIGEDWETISSNPKVSTIWNKKRVDLEPDFKEDTKVACPYLAVDKKLQKFYNDRAVLAKSVAAEPLTEPLAEPKTEVLNVPTETFSHET